MIHVITDHDRDNYDDYDDNDDIIMMKVWQSCECPDVNNNNVGDAEVELCYDSMDAGRMAKKRNLREFFFFFCSLFRVCEPTTRFLQWLHFICL